MNKRCQVVAIIYVISSIVYFVYSFYSAIHISSGTNAYNERIIEASRKCPGLRGKAIEEVDHFCQKTEIICSNTIIPNSKYSPGMYTAEYNLLRLGLTIDENNQTDKKRRFFSYDCDSKEIQAYIDLENTTQSEEFPMIAALDYSKAENEEGDVFLSDDKAKEKLFRLASNIGLPDDMVFIKSERITEQGLFQGYWQRQLNGIPYENDIVLIGIRGHDGLLLYFYKLYEGVAPQNSIKINKTEASKQAWENFLSVLPSKVEEVAYRKYSEEISLKIVRNDIFFRKKIPIDWENSIYAWEVKYYLSEEILSSTRSNEPHLTAKGLDAHNERQIETYKKYGGPRFVFEILIDAESGKVLYQHPGR